MPWERAFETYRSRAGLRSRTVPFAHRRVNWSWLTDLEDPCRAVDVGSPFGDVAVDLALEFPDVGYVGGSGLHGRLAAARTAGCHRMHAAVSPQDWARMPRNAADLVAFTASQGWAGRVPDALTEPERLVDACVDWLRPGGWFGAILPNPAWHRSWRHGGRTGQAFQRNRRLVRAFRKRLSALGVRDVREFLVGPDMDVPRVFVPRRRAAVRAFQGATHASVRERIVTDTGLHAALFPALLLLARR